MAKKKGGELFLDWANQVSAIDAKWHLDVDGFGYSPRRKLNRVRATRASLVRKLNEKAFGYALMSGDGQLIVDLIRGNRNYRAFLVQSNPAA